MWVLRVRPNHNPMFRLATQWKKRVQTQSHKNSLIFGHRSVENAVPPFTFKLDKHPDYVDYLEKRVNEHVETL